MARVITPLVGDDIGLRIITRQNHAFSSNDPSQSVATEK